VFYVRGSASFEEDVDSQSREYQEDDGQSNNAGSKQPNSRVSSQASFQWPDRGQPAAIEKKVIVVVIAAAEIAKAEAVVVVVALSCSRCCSNCYCPAVPTNVTAVLFLALPLPGKTFSLLTG